MNIYQNYVIKQVKKCKHYVEISCYWKMTNDNNNLNNNNNCLSVTFVVNFEYIQCIIIIHRNDLNMFLRILTGKKHPKIKLQRL